MDNPQTRTRGIGFVSHTAMPAQFAVPGTINAPYQPPARALSLTLEMGQSSREVQVLGECPAEQLSPETAEANQAFDGYMDSLQNAGRSRDYTAHMWSQTTLGQGTWVAENEGARVYQTDSWGIQGPEGRIDSPAYNTTNFTGENPWRGTDLELIDTRAEYERYMAQ